MTNAGLVLLISSSGMAVLGIALLLLDRHSARTSQGASLALFSHGAFATAGLLFVLSLFHIHSLSPFVLHIHGLGESLAEDFDCDLSVECVAVSSLLIAGIVFGMSALLGQLGSRALLRQYRDRRVDSEGLPRDLVPDGIGLWLVDDTRADAFAVAVARFGWPRLVRMDDIVVVTTALRDMLTVPELRAALAHEVAHVRAHDSRYLPLVRTLASVLFLDPVLGLLSRRLAIRYEFGADEDAAKATRDPRSLASALLRMASEPEGGAAGTSLLGGPRRPLLVERIERLLALAERMGL